ncbi:MAG: hypothetical protein F6K17_23660 [Okeania sp. SIO3C4]|nr:hypothetical protein [Okeania sp. SIO3B3]NER05370.1 hypothetical protein [Okeania sp. SIO3C4]
MLSVPDCCPNPVSRFGRKLRCSCVSPNFIFTIVQDGIAEERRKKKEGRRKNFALCKFNRTF